MWKGFAGAAEAIIRFNKRLIDALCDIVPAVKPQLAYYEMYGVEGSGHSLKRADMQSYVA